MDCQRRHMVALLCVRTFDHSVFLIEGSNHSYHRALHCLGVLRTSREDIRALLHVNEVSQNNAKMDVLPLVLPILRNCGLENLILGVLLTEISTVYLIATNVRERTHFPNT